MADERIDDDDDDNAHFAMHVRALASLRSWDSRTQVSEGGAVHCMTIYVG
jgi:hypothetical protein